MTTEERKLAIAKFDGYKFGYYEAIEDHSSGDDLNYCWVRVKKPFIYREESEIIDRDLHKEYDPHYRGSYRKVFYTPLDGFNYADLLEYDLSWKDLMPVVEKIEIQHGFVVLIDRYDCIISPTTPKMGNSNSIHRTVTTSKIEAVFLAVSDFCINYNQVKL